MQGGPKNPNSNSTDEPVLSASTPDKPKEDAFSKAFAELDKQKLKGEEVNQEHVTQIEKELKKIQDSDAKPKEKEAKMKSYLVEETRDGKAVGKDVLSAVDADVAKKTVPKTDVEKASEKHGLNELQTQKLQEFKDAGSKILGSDHQAKQQKYSKYADEANTQSYKDIYKKDMKNSLKQFKNAFTDQEVAKDENEAFAQLMKLLMEMLAFLFSPLSNLGNAAGEKAKNAIKEKFWDVMSSMQGNKFNDPSNQKGVLKGLEGDRDATESKIFNLKDSQLNHKEGSRKYNQIGDKIKFHQAKLDVVNNALDKTKSHLVSLQQNDLKDRKEALNDKKAGLTVQKNELDGFPKPLNKDDQQKLDKADKKLAKINKELATIDRQQKYMEKNPGQPLPSGKPSKVEKEIDKLEAESKSLAKNIEGKKKDGNPDPASAEGKKLQLYEDRKAAVDKATEGKLHEFKASLEDQKARLEQQKPETDKDKQALNEKLAKNERRLGEADQKLAAIEQNQPKPDDSKVTLGTPKPEAQNDIEPIVLSSESQSKIDSMIKKAQERETKPSEVDFPNNDDEWEDDKEAGLDEPKGTQTKADSTATTPSTTEPVLTASTSEPVLSATTPDKPESKPESKPKPKPKEDAFSKAFAELDKQKAKGDDVNQEHVTQIEKELKKIQDSEGKPKEKEAKMKSFLVEETRNNKAVAKDVLTAVDADVAKKVVPKTAVEMASEKNNLTDDQKARLEDRQKKSEGLLRGDDHGAKQKRYEGKADKANVDKLGDIYKKHGKNFLKDFGKNPLGTDANGKSDPNKVAKDEYEAFAQLMLMIMQAVALLLAPLAEKAKNGIKEALYEKIAKDQGKKHNDPVVQRNFLGNLEKDIDKTERNIHQLKQRQANHKPDSRKFNQLQKDINYNQAKLDVLNHTKDKTDAHLKNLQKNYVDNKEKQLNQQIKGLQEKAKKEPNEEAKAKIESKIKDKENQLADVKEKQAQLGKKDTKAIREPKPDLAAKRVKNLENREKAIEKAIENRQKKLDKADPDSNKHKVLAKQQENTQKFLEKTQKQLEDRTKQLQASLEREEKQLKQQEHHKRSPSQEKDYQEAIKKNQERQAETQQKLKDIEDKKQQKDATKDKDQQVTMGTAPKPEGTAVLSEPAGNKPAATGPTSPGFGTDEEAERIRRERDEADKRTAEENARMQVAPGPGEDDKDKVAAKPGEDDKDKAAKEAEDKARLDAEQQKAKEEADKKAEQDAKNKAAPKPGEDDKEKAVKEAEEKARLEAEQQKAKDEADKKAQQEAKDKVAPKPGEDDQAKAAKEAEEKARLEAEQQKAKDEADKKAQQEEKDKVAPKPGEDDKDKAAKEAEEKAKADAEAKEKAEQEAKQKAEEEAKAKANEEAQKQAEENNQLNQGIQPAAATTTAVNDDEANKDKEKEKEKESDRIEQDEEQGVELNSADRVDDDNDPNSPAAEKRRAANQGAVTASPTEPTEDQEQEKTQGIRAASSQLNNDNEGAEQNLDEEEDTKSAKKEDEQEEEPELQQGLNEVAPTEGAAKPDDKKDPIPQVDGAANENPGPAPVMASPGKDEGSPAPKLGSDDEGPKDKKEEESSLQMSSPTSASPMSSLQGGGPSSSTPSLGGGGGGEGGPSTSMPSLGGGGGGGGGNEASNDDDGKKQMAMSAAGAAVGVPSGGEMAASGGGMPSGTDMPSPGGGGMPSPSPSSGSGGMPSPSPSSGGGEEAPKKKGGEEKKDDNKSSSKGGGGQKEDNSEYGEVSKVMAEMVKMIVDVLKEAVGNVAGGMSGGPEGGGEKNEKGNGKSAPKGGGEGKGKSDKEGKGDEGPMGDLSKGGKEFTKGLAKFAGAIASFAESMSSDTGADQSKAIEETLKMMSQLFKGMGKVVKGGMEGGGQGMFNMGGGSPGGPDGGPEGGPPKEGKKGEDGKEPPSKNQKNAEMIGSTAAMLMGIPPPANAIVGKAFGEAIGKLEKLDPVKGLSSLCETLAEGCNVTSSKPNPGDVAMQKASEDSAAVIPAATKGLSETPGVKQQAQGPGAGANADAGPSAGAGSPPPTPAKSPAKP